MSLSTDIATVVTSSLTAVKVSKTLTKPLVTNTVTLSSPVYFPRLSSNIGSVITTDFMVYPNSKRGIVSLPDSTLYTKIIATVVYFPRLVIDVTQTIVTVVTAINVKPLKQYLANFWS